MISAVIAGRIVGRATNRLGGFAIATSMRNILGVSVVMALASWVTAWLIRHGIGTQGTLLKLSYRPALLVEVGLSSLVGVTVFLAVGRLVGITELRTMLSGVRRRVDRRQHPGPPRSPGVHQKESPTMSRTRPSVAPRRSPLSSSRRRGER